MDISTSTNVNPCEAYAKNVASNDQLCCDKVCGKDYDAFAQQLGLGEVLLDGFPMRNPPNIWGVSSFLVPQKIEKWLMSMMSMIVAAIFSSVPAVRSLLEFAIQ